MWLENVLLEQYRIIKVIKKNEKKEIMLLENIDNHIRVICRKYFDKIQCDVYNILTKIKSPNLVEVYDTQEDNDSTIILEEYVDGISIAELIVSDKYTPYGMKRVIEQVCCGVGVLHRNAIIHRDLKPENILIDSKGNVKVIDYDAAKIYMKDKDADTVLLGTAGYAAPEQYGIVQSDMRADIYALGVLINVLLTGEHPSKKMCTGKYKRVVEKCTKINPDDRYQSIWELKKHL
mgnify:CR=1 FL=1